MKGSANAKPNKRRQNKRDAEKDSVSLWPLVGMYFGIFAGAIAIAKIDNGDSEAALCRGVHDGYEIGLKGLDKGVSHVS